MGAGDGAFAFNVLRLMQENVLPLGKGELGVGFWLNRNLVVCFAQLWMSDSDYVKTCTDWEAQCSTE